MSIGFRFTPDSSPNVSLRYMFALLEMGMWFDPDFTEGGSEDTLVAMKIADKPLKPATQLENGISCDPAFQEIKLSLK